MSLAPGALRQLVTNDLHRGPPEHSFAPFLVAMASLSRFRAVSSRVHLFNLSPAENSQHKVRPCYSRSPCSTAHVARSKNVSVVDRAPGAVERQEKVTRARRRGLVMESPRLVSRVVRHL